MSDPHDQHGAHGGSERPDGVRSAMARRGVGPLVLLVPIAALLAAVMWLRAGEHGGTEGRGSTAPPSIESGDAVVAGWRGSAALERGVLIEARLAALHVDPERQAFDRDALRERFGLGAGEPWRLVLAARSLAADDAAPGSDGGASPPSGAPSEPSEPPAVADLRQLELTGLAPLARGAAPEAGAVADPVATLFAPPAGPLRAGEQVALYFWGERSRGAIEVLGVSAPLVLAPAELSEPRTTASLARIPERVAEPARAPGSDPEERR